MIKPASSLCNMRCGYCFYHDVSKRRQVKSFGIMDGQIAKKVIDRAFEAVEEGGEITFSFQGGEPTLAGLDFFLEFTEYADSLKSRGNKINYSIQTNGYVIDDSWSAFFSENNFLVGLSFDAYRQVHDYYRKDAKGRDTSKIVLKTIELFKKHKVEYNILTVISRNLAKHPVAAYNSFVKNKFEFVQLIPCLAPLYTDIDGKTDLTPRLYADFMKKFFDLWEKGFNEGKFLSVREFENILSKILGMRPEQCGMEGFCTPQFIVEADGGVYPCDFYVLDKYLSGNVKENTPGEITESSKVKQFISDDTQLHPLCGECKVYNLCAGGCKRYRQFYMSEKDYCPYQDFLYYTVDRFANIARVIRSRG